ncbi:hypothetical protein ACHAWF_018724 [Thalassiosira exigua]
MVEVEVMLLLLRTLTGMLSPSTTRDMFALCILMLVIYANGFIIGSPPHLCRNQWGGSALIMANMLYDDGHETIYPADTLQSSINTNGAQTLAPDIAYFYLQNTLGLSEEVMWKITLEAGSILGMSARNLEKKVSLLRRSMNLSQEDIRIILGKQPALLHYSAERNLAPTILFLVRALDLSKSDLRKMVMDCPSILGYSLGNLGKKIAFFRSLYSEGDSGGIDEIRTLVVGTPKLLLCAVDTGLAPRLKFLLNEIQFSLDELRTLYKKNPRLLLYSLDDNLREKIVFFFILQLRMDPKDVRSVMLRFPQIMDYNLERHMKPIATYFMTELEFSAAELGSIIGKFPRLFSYSLFKIRHVAGFLRYELQLDPRQAKRVLFQAPQVVGLDTDVNLKGKLDFLRDRLTLSQDELRSVLSKMPTLLQLGVDSNLMPKLDYLECALMGQDIPNKQLLRETVLKQPTLLGYSLNGRIRPRLERLIAAGIAPNKISVGISMSEANFEQWLLSSQLKLRKASSLTSTAAEILHRELGFSGDDMNSIRLKLPKVDDWNSSSLRSWIKYLKKKIPTTYGLKDALLSQPLLLDGSFRQIAKVRLKILNSAPQPVFDNIGILGLSENDFDDWMRRSRSKLAYMKKELHLNATECDAILARMPILENAPSNKIFRTKLDYFMNEFRNSTGDVKSLLLRHPSILGLSITQVMKPRLQKLRLAGVSDPGTISDFISIGGNIFLDWSTPDLSIQLLEMVDYLKSSLHFNEGEIERLCKFRQSNLWTGVENAERIVGILLRLVDDDVSQVKAAVLEHPYLLSFSSAELESRVYELTSLLHTPREIVAKATLTTEDYQTFITLRKMPNVLGRSRRATRFWNETRTILEDTLELSESDSDFILSRCRNLSLRNPVRHLVPKLNYLLAMGGDKNEVANCIMQNPGLLDRSLRHWIMPRMKLLANSGLNPFEQISEVAGLTDKEMNERLELQTHLDLTNSEVEYILPMKDWLAQRSLRRRAAPIINYLTSQLSIGETKCILLGEPNMFTLSLPKTIKPRMEMLLEAGGPPTKIGNIVKLTPRKAKEYCLKCYLSKILDFSAMEMDSVLESIGATWQSMESIKEILDFLLVHVFNGSAQKMRAVILDDPKVLKQSLTRTIRPRAEVLKYLELMGFEQDQCSISKLFTQSDFALTKELLPDSTTWYPPAIYEGQQDDVEHNDATTREGILSTMHDLAPSFTLAYSDELNRDGARVVHWR